MIFDHKGSSEAFFKSSITSHGQKFQVSKYKQFSFSASHKYNVKVSSAMSGFVSYSFALLKPNAMPRFPTTPVYDSLVSVKKAKLDDVKSLYKYLREDTIAFIDKIPAQQRETASDGEDGD